MELHYIWIDALCIFQDDESDWLEQSSQMHNIYGNSTLTLAPVASKSASQGFLNRRTELYASVPWRMAGDGARQRQGFIDLHLRLTETSDLHREQLDGPWSKRAWTLQEGLLSERILFYTPDEMVWKCSSEILCERGVRVEPFSEVIRGFYDHVGARSFSNLDLFSKLKLLQWYIQGPGCQSPLDKYLVWYSLIEDYSARQLSYPTDRLVAISGMAKMYGDIIGDDQYYAGLWKEDMIRGLLWRTAKAKLFDDSIAYRSAEATNISPRPGAGRAIRQLSLFKTIGPM